MMIMVAFNEGKGKFLPIIAAGAATKTKEWTEWVRVTTHEIDSSKVDRPRLLQEDFTVGRCASHMPER